MKHAPHYTIGQVNFLFNSWTFKTYCEKKGIELDDLYTVVSEGKGFNTKHLPALLAAGAQSFALYNNQPFTEPTEVEVFGWIDEIGGFNSMKVVDVFKVFASKLLNVDMDKLEVQESDEKNAAGQEVVTA